MNGSHLQWLSLRVSFHKCRPAKLHFLSEWLPWQQPHDWLKTQAELPTLFIVVYGAGGFSYSEAKQCNIKLTNPFCPVLINICNTDGTKTAMRCTGTR